MLRYKSSRCLGMEMIVRLVEDSFERSRSQFTSAPGGLNDINDLNYRANVLSLLSSPAHSCTLELNECLYIECAERRNLAGEHTNKGELHWIKYFQSSNLQQWDVPSHLVFKQNLLQLKSETFVSFSLNRNLRLRLIMSSHTLMTQTAGKLLSCPHQSKGRSEEEHYIMTHWDRGEAQALLLFPSRGPMKELSLSWGLW